jgi:hypothetical protein
VDARGCWHVHPDSLLPLPEGEWDCEDLAARLAERGWTLVPVDTVADAEALAALQAAIHEGQGASIRLSPGGPAVAWIWDPEDPLSALCYEGPTLAAAVRAALGDEP